MEAQFSLCASKVAVDSVVKRKFSNVIDDHNRKKLN